jgi:type VI secretion system secreted protein Hcp
LNDHPVSHDEEADMTEREYYFLKLDGISGESQDPDHAGWIDVESFGVRTSRSDLSSHGAGPGKADFEIFSFVSLPGRHSPLLQEACRATWSINSAILEIVRGTGGTRTVSLRLRFTDLLVAMYQATEGNPPRDNFDLAFKGIRYEAGPPPPAAQTVRPVPRPPIRPAATRRALKLKK